MEVTFAIIDRKPHLNEKGVRYLTRWVKKLYLVTNNGNHPAFNLKDMKNFEVIRYTGTIELEDLLVRLKEDYAIEKITLQTGGTLTSVFLKKKLFDHVSVVIAPCLIGGKDTSTSVDGKSLHSEKDLTYIKALELKKCEVLKNSYIHLTCDVINETEIESKD